MKTKTFGELIRFHRRRLGLLSCDVDRMVGLRRRRISEIERGRKPALSRDQMIMLAEVLKLSPQMLEDSRNRSFPGIDFSETNRNQT